MNSGCRETDRTMIRIPVSRRCFFSLSFPNCRQSVFCGAEKMIVEITDPTEKKAIARNVLEALADWFGIEESREEYIIP